MFNVYVKILPPTPQPPVTLCVAWRHSMYLYIVCTRLEIKNIRYMHTLEFYVWATEHLRRGEVMRWVCTAHGWVVRWGMRKGVNELNLFVLVICARGMLRETVL